MAETPHVLMIAPLYLPAEGPAPPAGVRAHAFAVGLRNLGHDVTVVCGMPRGARPSRDEGVQVLGAAWLDLEGIARHRGLKSASLVEPRVRGGRARPTLVREAATRVIVPDRYFSWIPAAILQARRAARSRSIILSTGVPSAHVVARVAHGTRRWIADINDLWAGNPHRRAGPIRRTINQLLERSTLSAAVHILTVNDLMRRELIRRFDAPVSTILSGFDPREFPAAERRAHQSLRLLFAGTLYSDFQLSPLYQAVAEGRQEGWLGADRLKIEFVGPLTERVRLEAAERGIADILVARAPVARKELIHKLTAADALLLPLYTSDPYSLPMRFFEYVGAGRPIIAIGPPDRLPAQLVRARGLGVVLSESDQVKEFLRSAMEDPSRLPVPDPDARAEFTWDHSVRQLSRIITELDGKGPT